MGKSILSHQTTDSTFIEYSKLITRDLTTYKRVLLTEGGGDVKILLPVLCANDIFVRSMGGKDRLLRVSPKINKKFNSHKVHFLVDCDGKAIQGIYPGSSEYITLSKFRDIESDIIFDTTIVRDLIIKYSEHEPEKNLQENENLAKELINKASFVCIEFGMIADAASNIGGIKMSIRDENCTKGKRRIRIDEIKCFNASVENQGLLPNHKDILADLEIVFKEYWSQGTRDKILEYIKQVQNKKCKYHQCDNCFECNLMNFVNGHDLVTALSCFISKSMNLKIGAKKLDDDLREAFSVEHLSNLNSYSRILKGYGILNALEVAD